MKNLKYYLNKAQKEKWAIGQFNFSDFTQLKAIVETVQSMNSPIILGTSEGESKFFGLEEAVAIRDVFRKKLGISAFLNLDHGKSFEYIKKAVDAGYDMVHFDGSKLPLAENIKLTKEVVKYVQLRGIWRSQTKCLVEGEIGKMGTDSSKIYLEKFEIKEEDLTKPDQVKAYIKETNVDLLAVSIGSFHGVEVSNACPNLRLNLLKEIKKENNNIFLVLHGGSGVPEDDIKEAINIGIVKTNINTELRIAFTGNLRRTLNNNIEEVVPYKFLAESKKSVAMVVEQKIKLFGSENKV